jgi:flagellar biosynthesis anti-sigma factor FlgM
MPTEINTGQASLQQSSATKANASKASALEKPAEAKTGEQQAASEPSSVVISESGQKLQALEESIRQEPQVRVDVVREIQKRVENGVFPIDVENLAKQIMDQESDF